MSKYSDPNKPGVQDSLSAFLDNEATDADIEALLAIDTQTLAQKADHYQQIHNALQADSEPLIFDSAEFLNGINRCLSEGVEDSNVLAFPKRNPIATTAPPQSIASAPTATTHSKEALPRKKKSFVSGLAIAASVAFAVVLGGNLLLNNNMGMDAPVFASNASEQELNVAAPTTDSGLNFEDNERLQNYLRQHAQQASMTVGQGMIPMAKVVGYPQGNAQ